MINCMNGGPTTASARDFMQPDGKCWVMRYNEDTPAMLALKCCLFTEESGSGFKGRRGVPQINLDVISVFMFFFQFRELLYFLSVFSVFSVLTVLSVSLSEIRT